MASALHKMELRSWLVLGRPTMLTAHQAAGPLGQARASATRDVSMRDVASFSIRDAASVSIRESPEKVSRRPRATCASCYSVRI